MNGEFEHRALFVNHAVELAVGSAAEMTAPRQIANILCDSCNLKRLAVDAGVMPIGVPDENRMVGRNRIQLREREIAALQKIVEIGADDPLSVWRGRRLLLEMRDKTFAGRIFGIADVVEQFEDQRGEDRVAVRIDEPWQHRAAVKIDDFGVAGLETGQCALIANRKHLTALNRDRGGDWRACQRTNRPAA